MFRVVTMLIFALLLAVPAARAETQAASVSPHLADLASLVGGPWRGTFPDGETTDVQRFEWMLDGHFLRNTHEVINADGKVVYAGETVYGWDLKSESIHWWYFNTTGGYLTGSLVESEGRWLAEGVNHGPEGQTARVRSELELGDGRWTSTSFFLKDGAWTRRFTMEFLPAD